MTLTNPYRQHHYIGEYANDAAANAWLVAVGFAGAAGLKYFNTTTGQPQYHTGAAWERYVVVLNSQAAVPNGVVGAPGLAFDGDLTSGLYLIAGGQVGMAAGGALIAWWGPSRFQISGNRQIDFNGGSGIIRHLGAGLPFKFVTTQNIYDFDLGSESGATSLSIRAADVAVPAPNDTAGGAVYVRVKDGGVDTDSSGGEAGASVYYDAGDGSASGGGGTDGGDGGHHYVRSGVGGVASGMGVNGVDGLVYLTRTDGTGFYDDIRITPGAFEFAGVADPTLVNWQPGGAGTTFKVYEFATNDEVYFTFEVPHGYREGTDLFPHVHWTPGARGVLETGNTVFWRVDFSIANEGAAYPSAVTVQLHDTVTGTDHLHERTPYGTGISGVGLQISAVAICRLYRAAGDSWAGAISGSLPLLLEFSVHYQKDTPGSRDDSGTK